MYLHSFIYRSDAFITRSLGQPRPVSVVILAKVRTRAKVQAAGQINNIAG